MSKELIFYTNPMSRGRIVRWMLEEVGEPYRTEVLPFGPQMKTQQYLAVNPMGKVPALRHGETVVTECAAICAYLADAFPAANLAPPPSSPLRGPYYRWLFFGAGPVEAASSNKNLGFEVPRDQQGFIGYGNLDDVVRALKTAVRGRRYLVGDQFTAADVYLGSQIGWLTQFGIVPNEPEFVQYVGSLRERPAAQRAREMDDKLAEEMQLQMPKAKN